MMLPKVRRWKSFHRDRFRCQMKKILIWKKKTTIENNEKNKCDVYVPFQLKWCGWRTCIFRSRSPFCCEAKAYYSIVPLCAVSTLSFLHKATHTYIETWQSNQPSRHWHIGSEGQRDGITLLVITAFCNNRKKWIKKRDLTRFFSLLFQLLLLVMSREK